MALKLHNTLSRSKEDFTPFRNGTVSFYTCGPTVYDSAHIGNLRTYVFEDTLRRWLEYGHGLKVNQVMNITDVEDKIITRSGAQTATEMCSWTGQYEKRFYADLALLGVEKAESYPKATDYIPQMIAMVEQIIAAGLAYEREGSVYLDVRKYHQQHGYGTLLNIDPENFGQVSRIDADEYDKDSPQDFALWKAEQADKPGWESPWGYGRPGWHLECSVMAREELGETIDIHAGAVDLIFPHHENEIAQTKAATGKPLARYWLHAEHLLVDGARMAKSENNFYTLADVTKKGFEPAVLRLMFLSAHYRSKLNFTWDSLASAKESLERIRTFLRRLSEPPGEASSKRVEVDKSRQEFDRAMDDDLNTPEALAVIFELITDVNAAIDEGGLGEDRRQKIRDFLAYADTVLGIVSVSDVKPPGAVQKLADKRENARGEGDFKESDRLRDEIIKAGWEVEDTAQGQRLRKR